MEIELKSSYLKTVIFALLLMAVPASAGKPPHQSVQQAERSRLLGRIDRSLSPSLESKQTQSETPHCGVVQDWVTTPFQMFVVAAELARLREKAAAVDARYGKRLSRAVNEYCDGPILGEGVTATLVVDGRSGRRLVSRKAAVALNPASNVKLVSTATALDILGADWRYQTFVAGRRNRRGDTVKGDLYLFGSYDPTLTGADYMELAQKLALARIKRIGGDVVLTEGALMLGRPTAVTLAISVHTEKQKAAPDRRFDSAARPRIAVEVEPDLPFLHKAVKARIVSHGSTDLKARVTVQPGGRVTPKRSGVPSHSDLVVLTLEGQLRADQEWSGTVTVRDRRLDTALAVWKALSEAGIEVDGTLRRAGLSRLDAPRAAKYFLPLRLAAHHSRNLASLVKTINKRSVNFLADRVIMTAGAMVYGGRPTLAKGVRVMRRWLARRAAIDPNAVVLDTGSGLSYRTRMTATQIVRVLRVLAGLKNGKAVRWRLQPVLRHWGSGAHRAHRRRFGRRFHQILSDSLPVAKKDGTLSQRFAYIDLKGRVTAKTGTLNGIIALSGFHSYAGVVTAFAVVTNGADAYTSAAIRYRQGELLGILDRYLTRRAQAIEDLQAKMAPHRQRLALLNARILSGCAVVRGTTVGALGLLGGELVHALNLSGMDRRATKGGPKRTAALTR